MMSLGPACVTGELGPTEELLEEGWMSATVESEEVT